MYACIFCTVLTGFTHFLSLYMDQHHHYTFITFITPLLYLKLSITNALLQATRVQLKFTRKNYLFSHCIILSLPYNMTQSSCILQLSVATNFESFTFDILYFYIHKFHIFLFCAHYNDFIILSPKVNLIIVRFCVLFVLQMSILIYCPFTLNLEYCTFLYMLPVCSILARTKCILIHCRSISHCFSLL